MKYLYISYWSITEPLTEATVVPHLQVLLEMPNTEQVVFCSLENQAHQFALNHPKLIWKPLVLQPWHQSVIRYISYVGHVKRVAGDFTVDRILCKGATAGSIGFRVHKKLGAPFFVESFEPHARYMLDAGVWKSWGLNYLLHSNWEQKQKKYAAGLMPVSHNYFQQLASEGIAKDRMQVLPCTVDTEYFKPTHQIENIKASWGFSASDKLMIYVGKFGDIYLDQQAFELFHRALEYCGSNSKIIIASPQEKSKIVDSLISSGIPKEQFLVVYANRSQLVELLSVADLAFCTVRPGPSRRYCSPVKNGEYWAMGLPVIIPGGIGDDSDLVRKYQAGVVLEYFSEAALLKAFNEVERILEDPESSSRIQNLAKQYRSRSLIAEAYRYFFA